MSPYRGVDRDDHARVVVGRVLIQALMWTVPDEVVLVLMQDSAGVLLVVDQDPVGALGPDAADEAFREGVRPRGARWSLDHVDAFGGEHGVEGSGELRVPVADQEPEGGDPIAEIHHQVACQLRRPASGRVLGDAEDVYPSGGDLHNEQHVQSA